MKCHLSYTLDLCYLGKTHRALERHSLKASTAWWSFENVNMHINCIRLLMPRSVIIRAASIIDTDTDADILVYRYYKGS